MIRGVGKKGTVETEVDVFDLSKLSDYLNDSHMSKFNDHLDDLATDKHNVVDADKLEVNVAAYLQNYSRLSLSEQPKPQESALVSKNHEDDLYYAPNKKYLLY